ncbi:MAG: GNAT family N-acetyltransferase [Bacteroidetes bacterium]|nr:MAG: GNAT family N-acetyltransferase [Bacteroidota bacterium]
MIPNRSLDAQRWDAFIESSPQGSLYLRYDYASLLFEEWEALIVREEDTWLAVMPLARSERLGFRRVLQPVLAQHWGLCFVPAEDRPYREYLSLKRQVIIKACEAFDRADICLIHFSPEFDYGLPFHWAGFELRTRYTYWLELDAPPAVLFHRLADPLRRQVRKTERNHLEVRIVSDPTGFLDLVHQNRLRGHDVLGGNVRAKNLLPHLCKLLTDKGWGEILELRTASGDLHAALLLGRHRDHSLYLLGAYHPEQAQSGAMSRLMWEAIAHAALRGDHIFDFEGSMIEGVEDFFRKFGARPVPYLQIRRNRLPFFLQWIPGLQ